MNLATHGATRLSGHLELVAAMDAEGRTFLRHQSFQAPVHLGKGYTDPGTGGLAVNIVNPTAGLLDGDRLRIEVKVGGGARLLLTTPSASRAHTMRQGHAEVTQEFRVNPGGSLEWWPEVLIPQRGARYHQHTCVRLGDTAELIYQETLAPGRVASGEAFAYDELRWKTDIWRGDRLVVRERFLLSPENGALTALRRRFPTAYYASIFVASPLLTTATDPALYTLESDAVDGWVGVTNIAGGFYAIKIVAADSLVMRRALHRCRSAIHECLGRKAPGLRRAGEPG